MASVQGFRVAGARSYSAISLTDAMPAGSLRSGGCSNWSRVRVLEARSALGDHPGHATRASGPCSTVNANQRVKGKPPLSGCQCFADPRRRPRSLLGGTVADAPPRLARIEPRKAHQQDADLRHVLNQLHRLTLVSRS